MNGASALDAGASVEPDRYAQLAELADSGLEAALHGRLDELAEISRQWDALAGTLPPEPPHEAVPLLQRAAQLNDAARTQLLAQREALAHQAAVTERAGRVARGYGAAGAGRSQIERNA